MALVVLRRYAMFSEAQAAAAALRASGVNAVLLDDAATPPYSGMPVMGGFRLAVSDEEAKDAIEILRGALTSSQEAAPQAADEPPEEPGWPGWDDTAGANPPVMPGVRRVGRVVVWTLFVLFAVMFALRLSGLGASGGAN